MWQARFPLWLPTRQTGGACLCWMDHFLLHCSKQFLMYRVVMAPVQLYYVNETLDFFFIIYCMSCESSLYKWGKLKWYCFALEGVCIFIPTQIIHSDMNLYCFIRTSSNFLMKILWYILIINNVNTWLCNKSVATLSYYFHACINSLLIYL